MTSCWSQVLVLGQLSRELINRGTHLAALEHCVCSLVAEATPRLGLQVTIIC